MIYLTNTMGNEGPVLVATSGSTSPRPLPVTGAWEKDPGSWFTDDSKNVIFFTHAREGVDRGVLEAMDVNTGVVTSVSPDAFEVRALGGGEIIVGGQANVDGGSSDEIFAIDLTAGTPARVVASSLLQPPQDGYFAMSADRKLIAYRSDATYVTATH